MKKSFPYSYLMIVLYSTFFTSIAYYLNMQSLIGIDDANIYMVYMRNLAHGHGFVYNVGGERVEGFTSLLWTLIGACFFLLSKKPELMLLVFNLIVVSYAIWKICLYINTLYQNKSFFSDPVILFLGLLVAVPGYFEWSILSLMETGLWGSLLILLALHVLRSNPFQPEKSARLYFAILLFLLCLCRPESMVWGPIFLIGEAYRSYNPTKNQKKHLISCAPMLAVFLGTQLLLLAWRLSYFGYPFPNTFYAKVGGNFVENIKSGMGYILFYFHQVPFYFFVFLLLLKWVYPSVMKIPKSTGENKIMNEATFHSMFLFSILLCSLLLRISTGSDHFPYFRMMQSTAPLAWLAFILTLNFFHFKWDIIWVMLIFIFAFFLSDNNLFHTWQKKDSALLPEFRLAMRGRNKSEQLNEFFKILPKYPTQGVLDAGGYAFAYHGVTIDLLGLNNVQMAHADWIKDRTSTQGQASFNKQVFYQLKPDLIWFRGNFVPISDTLNFGPINLDSFNLPKNINLDEKFKMEYSFCIIARKNSQKVLRIFAANDFLNSLDTTQFRVIKNPIKY